MGFLGLGWKSSAGALNRTLLVWLVRADISLVRGEEAGYAESDFFCACGEIARVVLGTGRAGCANHGFLLSPFRDM
jgi:hypothetical protein